MGIADKIKSGIEAEKEEERQILEAFDKDIAERKKSGILDASPPKRTDTADKAESKSKNELNYKNLESLQPAVNIVNEAALALSDKTRTIKDSPIPEVLAGALGAGAGGIASFAVLYTAGTVGLSAAGITSGLAAAGSVIGGGMVAGIFVLAAPVAALAAAGAVTAKHLKDKQFREERDRLYKDALKKHDAIINELENSDKANKERIEYLQSINILLRRIIAELEADINN